MSNSTKGKKKPVDSWVVGTVTLLPTKKEKPYVVQLETPVNGYPFAALYRKTVKNDVGDYDKLAVGTSIKCDVSERENGRPHLVRHCALA